MAYTEKLVFHEHSLFTNSVIFKMTRSCPFENRSHMKLLSIPCKAKTNPRETQYWD